MPFHTTVRGRLRHADPAEAQRAHDDVVASLIPTTQGHGGSGHRVFGDVGDPQEFLALDTWDSIEGLRAAFADESVQARIGSLFEEPPEVRIWSPREGWTTF